MPANQQIHIVADQTGDLDGVLSITELPCRRCEHIGTVDMPALLALFGTMGRYNHIVAHPTSLSFVALEWARTVLVRLHLPPWSRSRNRCVTPQIFRQSQANRILSRLLCTRYLFAALLLMVLVSGCGPERSASDQDSTAQATLDIALAYQSTHNLDEARSQLQGLDVANANQWLLLTVEETIKNSGNNAESSALVRLALDLGLQSNAIVTYARNNNIVIAQSSAVTVATPVVNTAPGGEALANNVGNVIVPLPAKDANSAQLATNEPNVLPTAVVGESSGSDSDEQNGAVNADTVTESAEPPTPEPSATPEPTATQDTQPTIRVASALNVRSGPGTAYPVAGALNSGDTAQIVGKDSTGDWWQITLATGGSGWVYAPLVEAGGDTATVAVALDIPAPPPTPVPAPTAVPVEAVPVEAVPVEEAAPAPAPGGPDFRIVEKRLWDVVENGGRLDGPSVTCGEKRQLVARVLDANGNLLNGVAVQAIYGAQEIFVTGTQGKGDGTVEFVLGGGQALKVIRDADGREVSSEEAYNMTTKPWEIPFETLIGGHFCTDDASCQSFVDATGCYGHYSWTVVFQRAY